MWRELRSYMLNSHCQENGMTAISRQPERVRPMLPWSLKSWLAALLLNTHEQSNESVTSKWQGGYRVEKA
jgi:hypothetical protein